MIDITLTAYDWWMLSALLYKFHSSTINHKGRSVESDGVRARNIARYIGEQTEQLSDPAADFTITCRDTWPGFIRENLNNSDNSVALFLQAHSNR
tara:strand:- start:134 stop:418 length:285 start_codon:yes stop_codon:yes gene_type:complete